MLQLLANALCRGAIYSLVAMGFGLIYSTTGVFHIAHGAVYALGAYSLFLAALTLHVPMVPAAITAVVLGALAGSALERFIYRPLLRKDASSATLMISSLGIYVVVVSLLALSFGNETRSFSTGAPATIRLGRVVLTNIQVISLATSSLVLAGYFAFLRFTALGQVCRAVADDPVLASVLGIRVDGARALVFALGSALGALGAVLTALDVGADPYVGMPVVLFAAAACIVGGLHRNAAPLLGAMLLCVLQVLVISRTSAQWESAVTFSVLVLFLLIRPQGILGRPARLDPV